jgi:DMSO/TMAO reductase YedYZ molybdopterin-dependent catalytic subunit
MRTTRLRPLALAVIATAAAMALSVSGVMAYDHPGKLPKPPAAATFVVTGNVQHKLRLTVADLAAMVNQQTVDVTYHAGTGTEQHVFTGPLLLDVLTSAVPEFDPAIKNDKLRHFISVTASDTYQALVAYGEIDPSFENKKVLLAVTQDGVPLTDQGPRLVVPGDMAGGRFVTGVVKVTIDKPRR